MPPRPTNTADVKAIIDALASYEIDPEAFTFTPDSADGGLPPHLGPDTVKFNTSVQGTTFYAMPMQAAVPSTLFFHRTGFEIGIALSTTESPSSLWSELCRLVQHHDNPRTDHLLITAGGPGKSGFMFPSEHYLMNAALDAAAPLTGIQYLKSVTLHFWETGRIVELHPSIGDHGQLFPGQYAPAFFAATTTPQELPQSSFQWLLMSPDDEA